MINCSRHLKYRRYVFKLKSWRILQLVAPQMKLLVEPDSPNYMWYGIICK